MTNPLLSEWQTPHGVPPFDLITPENLRDAFDKAFSAHLEEVEAILKNDQRPSFENVIEALEKSGKSLQKVSSVFSNLSGAHTNDDLQEIEREISPKMSAHFNTIYLNGKLFEKVDALWEGRENLGLSEEQFRVLERYHIGFLRSGARLDDAQKKRMAEISGRLASLYTDFGQHVLADEAAYTLVLEGEDDLVGLPSFARDAAAQAAEERGLTGKHVITLARSSIEPFLQFSARRDLREKAFNAWSRRGENDGATDNRGIIAEIVQLRHERAQLLGFESFAAFKLDDQMAKSPERVDALLSKVWEPALARAKEESEELQSFIQNEGGNFDLAPHDWRYYAEKLRKEQHDFNEEEIKSYLQLDKIIEAAFDTATRLFGLTFEERKDIPLYQEDVRAWDVIYPDGRERALFIGDYFSRQSKRSGAWMSGFRGQEKLSDDKRPIIVNVLNFSKAPGDAPTLLSFDDAITLFHEFGHGLHGLLSDVTYPSLSGTSVARDFVELPSQLFEHWIRQPEVLKRFALHHETGEPMPDALIERVVGARNFNQGFSTVEYLACAILDMELHKRSSFDGFDASDFERTELEKLAMPSEIVMRHRIPHFAHAFSGDGYSAGYYSYMWSEVMDADAFAAFEETGDIFDRDLAKRLHDNIYSVGGSVDPEKAYEAFRGRLPEPDALLKKRGFAAA